jgi:hypothetical protein
MTMVVGFSKFSPPSPPAPFFDAYATLFLFHFLNFGLPKLPQPLILFLHCDYEVTEILTQTYKFLVEVYFKLLYFHISPWESENLSELKLEHRSVFDLPSVIQTSYLQACNFLIFTRRSSNKKSVLPTFH